MPLAFTAVSERAPSSVHLKRTMWPTNASGPSRLPSSFSSRGSHSGFPALTQQRGEEKDAPGPNPYSNPRETMSGPNKYREWILETIDSLRSRKARPDLERICRMVRRRHGSDPDRTRTELEKLIQEQTVLKVSYKGSISYRNAAKVQRKSRKKSDFTAAGGGGGGGAEAARERTKHLNNNGDSAHSFTDQEDESEPSPPPQTPADKKPKSASAPSSGNGRLGGGGGATTTGCAAAAAAAAASGSGCEEEKASAARDNKGLGHQGAGGGGGGSGAAGPSGADKPPDAQNQTCPGSGGGGGGGLPQPRHRQPAPPQPKLRVAGGGGTKAPGGQQQQQQQQQHAAKSDLGDRLVASVRSLSERSLRGGSSSSSSSAAAAAASSAARGHMKPLGLKEILGYLSSQERLSEEKLTRGKVKVVMEREVARGRLRRTRCGNITLPLRGTPAEEPANPAADRLTRSAPQDEHTHARKPASPPEQDGEPMETVSEGDNDDEAEAAEEREHNEEEEDPRSSDEEGGLSPVAMTTATGLIEKSREDAEIQAASKRESPRPPQQGGKGADPPSRTPCPPVQAAPLSQCNSGHMETPVSLNLPRMETQNQMQPDRVNHSPSGFSGLECKTEVGVSSCLLTPTASPRDTGPSEERGMNGGVSSGGFMKSEGASGSPVDWTVSDVVSYFTAAGFPEQAAAFRTQEIDGKSLLLMQRNDVLTGLSIRLGPALKIYERHVKVLQKTHFEDTDC